MSIYNDAGYNDPTPYFAFKNMEREERKAHDQKVHAHGSHANTTRRYTA